MKRRMGTGTIYREDNRWVARSPMAKGYPGEVLGHFAFYHQAERAIAKWIAAHQQQAAEC